MWLNRLNFDDSWSYTNFSSSQTSETEVLELNKEADSDCTEKSKVSRTSSWKRVRPVIHLIPFVQLFKEKKYPWMQLAGHPGNFIKGEIQVTWSNVCYFFVEHICYLPYLQGTVLKKFNAAEERCYKQLMRDPLCQVVPQFYGVTRAVANPEEDQPQHYLELQCLLTDFHNPNICDTKLGVRTFLETEVLLFVICLQHQSPLWLSSSKVCVLDLVSLKDDLEHCF